MLAASGELDGRVGGRYVPSHRTSSGDVVLDETTDGARRRSVYLQQRRTQVVGMLEVFDAPSLVTNCTRRNSTTIPLQSLSLLNTEYVRHRAEALAGRSERLSGRDPAERISRLFELAVGRPPADDERCAASQFLNDQPARHPGTGDSEHRAWVDLCQMVLARNAFLYVE